MLPYYLDTIDIESLQIDCLRFVMCPLLVLVFQDSFSFFAVAINSTNVANKAGSTHL